MPFRVDFNWASQAIIETIAIPFPSLESPPDAVVADPTPPRLAVREVSDAFVTAFGNGKWRQDSSMQFNAGANDDKDHEPVDRDDRGILSQDDMNRLERWFMARYRVPGATPKVLARGNERAFTVVRNNIVYNFHILVG